jgi:hypothetical protein
LLAQRHFRLAGVLELSSNAAEAKDQYKDARRIADCIHEEARTITNRTDLSPIAPALLDMLRWNCRGWQTPDRGFFSRNSPPMPNSWNLLFRLWLAQVFINSLRFAYDSFMLLRVT